LDFRIHFVSLYQMFFDRTWGFGASIAGPFDQRSFQIGWPQWWFVLPLILVILFGLLKQKKVIRLLKIFNEEAFIKKN